MTYQRTLFISSYAPPAIGGPQNMYNLINSLPSDTYYILTSFYNINNLSARKGRWLPGKYIFYDSQQATEFNYRGITDKDRAKSGRQWAAQIKANIRTNPIIRILAGPPVLLGQIWSILRAGRTAIHQFNINRLMGFSDYGPAVIGTYLLHRQTGVPYHLFLFDIYKGNHFFFPGNWLANIFEERIFRAADKIAVTNRGTKEFYRQRYGDEIANKMVVIHNIVAQQDYLRRGLPAKIPGLPYVIMFTGRIYWPQIRSLKNLLRAVEGMTDMDIQIKIYSPDSLLYIRSMGLDSPKASFDMAPPSEIPRIQSQADILFLPLSWRTKSPAVINTATPGKLTDYLIAGRPMLIHAPASTYLVRYAKDNDFAMVVDREDIAELQTAIRKLLSNQELVGRLVKNAKSTFFEDYDSNHNIHIFQELLKTSMTI